MARILKKEGECDELVYTCENCGEYFGPGDNIYCDNNKHVCFECGQELVNKATETLKI